MLPMSPNGRTLRSFAACLLLFGLGPAARAANGWLPVSPEDLAMKDNPKQPGADAMILYRENVVDASKVTEGGDTDEEYFRIKVFTQKGTEQGHVEVDFVKESQSVPYIVGRTIRPDGTIVNFTGKALEATVVKAGGIRVLAKTFTLPDVTPGCIIEYKYMTQGKPDYVHDYAWTVTQPLYTRAAHFTYIPFTGNGSGLTPMARTLMLPASAQLQQKVDGSYTMEARDIPALIQEPLMPPERPLEARVEFYYRNPDDPPATDPAQKYWNAYAKKWAGNLEHFVGKKDALSQELSKIAGPGDSPEIKLRKIYARVLQVRNLNAEDYKTLKETKAEDLKPNNNVQDVLAHGYATSRQINWLFIGLARAAGFEATDVYLAPRNSDVFLPQQNDVAVLRTEIVWVRAGSQEYYLDPGARYFPFGLLPWYETGTGGIRVDKHGATITEIPNPVASQSTIVRSGDIQISDTGSMAGQIQVDLTGQRAALLRRSLRREDETGRTKDLEDQVKRWLPAGSTFSIAKISGWDDIERPVHLEGNLTIPSFGGHSFSQLLMPVEIFEPVEAADFLPETRVNMVYFPYPYEESDDLKIHAPAGYAVESAPPARNVDLKAVAYDISAAPAKDTIEMKRHLEVNGFLYEVKAYPTLRAFFNTVRTYDNGRMVLQKTSLAKAN